MKVVNVRFRVTARGCVAVTLKASRQGPRRACGTSGAEHWAEELHKSRLCAIRRAVRGVELETNGDRPPIFVDSDEEWFSAESE